MAEVFFNIDLDELINSGVFISNSLDNIGPALQKRVQLIPPQMGMFTDVDVTKLPDGTIWLDFLSSKYAPNKNLMDFMAYCYKKWGLDSQYRGMPSNKDVEDLRRGCFARTWSKVKILQIKRPEHVALSIVLRIIIDNR